MDDKECDYCYLLLEVQKNTKVTVATELINCLA